MAGAAEDGRLAHAVLEDVLERRRQRAAHQVRHVLVDGVVAGATAHVINFITFTVPPQRTSTSR